MPRLCVCVFCCLQTLLQSRIELSGMYVQSQSSLREDRATRFVRRQECACVQLNHAVGLRTTCTCDVRRDSDTALYTDQKLRLEVILSFCMYRSPVRPTVSVRAHLPLPRIFLVRALLLLVVVFRRGRCTHRQNRWEVANLHQHNVHTRV